ncbi:DUF2254 domain-containing protein [Tuberibacillus sp. Marseille-P3662]|uniref:DUF2254 domain-containing protein n=1 Tax=Tuberibacillus sp. Marseille-P3662 TaxID=1965358 RepID=UPI000A1C87CE|nr:DUF2254 domain-containing protein [Tuberibacillus sp. Marseille-P3662]
MNRTQLWISIRDSFWFVPTIYSILSLIAVTLVATVDHWVMANIAKHIPDLWLTDQKIAKTLYSSLITAILTMTTISFSSIMVVLTTYSSLFSPRTLQDFMRSRVTQHVLGVDSFGFIFILINLLLLTENSKKALISPIAAVIIAIACLACFILFMHHASRWVKVNFLIGRIRNEASGIINKVLSRNYYGRYTEWDDADLNGLKATTQQVIHSDRSGYIQTIDYRSLIDWAQKHHVVLKANFQIGDYVPKNMPLFFYWSEGNSDGLKSPQGIIIGDERTPIQDIEFAMQKIVDIALKSISPSINDPHTAINCINRLGGLLIELGKDHKPWAYYTDNKDQLRLIIEPKTFGDYLYKSFYQIRYYGQGDVSVIHGLLEVLYKIALVSDKPVKKDVWQFKAYVLDVVDWDNLSTLDAQHLSRMVEKVDHACE